MPARLSRAGLVPCGVGLWVRLGLDLASQVTLLFGSSGHDYQQQRCSPRVLGAHGSFWACSSQRRQELQRRMLDSARSGRSFPCLSHEHRQLPQPCQPELYSVARRARLGEQGCPGAGGRCCSVSRHSSPLLPGADDSLCAPAALQLRLSHGHYPTLSVLVSELAPLWGCFLLLLSLFVQPRVSWSFFLIAKDV